MYILIGIETVKITPALMIKLLILAASIIVCQTVFLIDPR
jgi:hypothetical protein